MSLDDLVDKHYGCGGIMEKIEADGPPPLGIRLLMGDKLQNYIQNLTDDRVSVTLDRAHKK